MAKKQIEQLDDRAFLIKQLREIADYEDGDPVVRLRALDRIAAMTQAYAVVPSAKAASRG